MSTGTTELDRPVPLYMQIVRQLRAQIASGELRDGDRLPSQREMMIVSSLSHVMDKARDNHAWNAIRALERTGPRRYRQPGGGLEITEGITARCWPRGSAT